MTAQIPERLVHDGSVHAMCAEPLGQFFALSGSQPSLIGRSTALWRRYIGTWEIVDRRLYLTDLQGTLANGDPLGLKDLFPGFPERVFGHWFCGEVRLPQGKQLEYVHMGYGSRHERDWFLEFERGCLVGERTVVNSVAPEGAPDTYLIAAQTLFGPK
jgi:hypothetical protein